MKKNKQWIERICAVLLALVVAFTTLVPQTALIVSAEEPTTEDVGGTDEETATPTETPEEPVTGSSGEGTPTETEDPVTPAEDEGGSEDQTVESFTVKVTASNGSTIVGGAKVTISSGNVEIASGYTDRSSGTYTFNSDSGILTNTLYTVSVQMDNYAFDSVMVKFMDTSAKSETISARKDPLSLAAMAGSTNMWPGDDTVIISTGVSALRGNTTVTWSSSDSSVATVANSVNNNQYAGKVTGLKPGTTTITATATDTETGQTVSNSHKITVDKPTLTLTLTAEVVSGEGKTGTKEVLLTTTPKTNASKSESLIDTSKLKYYYYTTDSSKKTEIKEAEGQTSYTFTNKNKITGNVTFVVSYDDDVYFTATDGSETVNVDKAIQKMVFENETDSVNGETNPLVLTRGDEDVDVDITYYISEKYNIDDSKVTYTIESSPDGAQIEVSKDGKFTLTNAGDDSSVGLVTVKVTEAEHDIYEEHVDYFYVYIGKTIGFDEIKDNTFTAESNVTYGDIDAKTFTITIPAGDFGNYIYDKGKQVSQLKITVVGTIAKDIDGKFVAAGTSDVTVSEIQSITVAALNADGDELSSEDLDGQSFQVTYGSSSSLTAANVTINKKAITLGTNDESVVFITADEKNVKTQIEEITNGVKVVDEIDDALISLLDENDITLTSTSVQDAENNFRITTEEDSYSVGEYAGYVHIKENSVIAENYKNFTFVTDPGSYGKLTVTEAQVDVDSYISFESDAEDGKIYKDGTTIWTDGNGLNATVASAEDGDVFAGAKVVVVDGDNVTDLSDYTGTGTKAVAIADASGKVLTKTTDYKIIADTNVPTFDFGSVSENTNKSAYESFTEFFNGIFNDANERISKKYDLTGLSSDDGDEGSGVLYWKYTVYKTDADVKAENLDIDAVEEFLGEDAVWTYGYQFDVSTKADVIDEIDNITVGDVEGNYLVIINISDRVGNQTTYTSEGIVLDYEAPEISIKYDDGNAGTTISGSKIYNSDVPFFVSITDPAVTSGLDTVKIEVLDNGKSLGDDYTWTKTLSSEETPLLSDLAESADKKYDGMAVKAELNSNNLTIKVTATDRAGNEYVEAIPVMVDNTKPVIDVTYSSDASVLNDKYLKAARTMKITYTEKNFDINKVKFAVLAGPSIDVNNPYKEVSLSGLSDFGISYNGQVTDSEAGGSTSTYTENRTNTITLTFSADNEYYIVPSVTDLAGNKNSGVTYSGNETETAKTTFVIDTTAPVLSTVFTSGDSSFTGAAASASAKTRGAYSNQDVTATVTVNEKNFALSTGFSSETSVSFSGIKGTEGKSGDVTPSCITVAENASSWSAQGTAHSVALKFPVGAAQTDANTQGAVVNDTTGEDANYVFTYTFTDLAGNSVTYTPAYFTADNDKPSGEYTVDGVSMWQKVLNVLTFGIFKINTSTVRLTGDDVTAGVDTIYYYKTSEYLTRSQFDSLKNSQWIAGTSFSVSPNEQYVVYQKIVDKAGNITYRYPANGIIEDNVGPVISLADASASSNGIHSADATVSVNVQDPVAGDTYSGIKYVWYKIESTTNQVNATPSERTAAYTLVDNSGNPVKTESQRTYNGSLVVPANQFNSNDVTVTVYAEDFAGSVTSEQIKLKIDVTAPVIENISWNTSAASNGKYYNVTRIATFTVRERNFDINQVRFNITNTDGTMPAISSWSVDSSGTSDDNISTVTVTFSADGDYNMNLSVTDLAGNASNTVTAEEFTIDKTAPTISVTFDNNDVRNGKYYNAVRTATITVNEHNFNSSDVTTAITASDETPSVSAWSSRNDVNTATVPFTAEGDYSFTVNYTDLAGNPATAYSVDEFTIDLTDPEIEIYDITNMSANKGTVAPGVRTTDRNYDTDGVSITYSGVYHELKAVDGTRTTIENGEDIKMDDFAHTEDVDDVYTMTATVTDLAGNWSEAQVIFSVNRFGSNFIFSDDTQDFLDAYYNKEEADIVVTEINVDTLTKRDISSSHDSEVTDLVEGTDYTVVESGSEVEWKSYEYTLDKSNFESEGLYNLTFASTDAAENSVTNKTKDKNCEFVIDKTAPTAVITGVENDGKYRAAEREMEVALADNIAVGRMDLYISNDENADILVASTDPESDAPNIVDLTSTIPYVLASSNEWQYIHVVAYDLAGNKFDSMVAEDGTALDAMRVLVTSNVLIQFYRNTPVFVVTIIALLLLLFLIIFLLAKRRKKDEDEKKASTAAK